MVSPDQITASLPPELRHLLFCSCPHPAPTKQVACQASAHGILCRDIFAALAAAHRRLSPACHQLPRLQLDCLQHSAVRCLATAARRWPGRSPLLGRELGRLPQTLTQQGIPALPYTGPVLAQQYCGQCWLYPAHAWPAVRQVPLAHGYQPVCHWHSQRQDVLLRIGGHEMFWHPGRQILLELHSRLLPLERGLELRRILNDCLTPLPQEQPIGHGAACRFLLELARLTHATIFHRLTLGPVNPMADLIAGLLRQGREDIPIQ